MSELMSVFNDLGKRMSHLSAKLKNLISLTSSYSVMISGSFRLGGLCRRLICHIFQFD